MPRREERTPVEDVFLKTERRPAVKRLFGRLTMAVALLGVMSVTAVAARQSGCITCHTDDAKMKLLVTFIPHLEGEGEG